MRLFHCTWFPMRSLAAGRNLYKIAHQKIIIGTKCKLKRRVDLESASARIGEESGGDRKSKVPRVEHLKSGREATGIPRVSRSRYQKLASVEGDSRKASGRRPHTRKSRQGFPGRLVPLRFAWRCAASSYVERRASSYLDALPSMRRQVALPMCRANDPRL